MSLRISSSSNSHSPTELPLWYSGGPCVSYLPLPILDPERPWGKADCNDCGGQCHGHFLKPEQAIGSANQKQGAAKAAETRRKNKQER